MPRRHRSLLLVAWLACLPPALSLLAPSASAEEAAPIVVEVASNLAYLDEAALRRAIGAELRAPAIAPGDAASTSARGTLSIGLDRVSGELLMAFRPRSGSPLMRKIKLPAAREDQLNTIALLAGNLARDEAAELLSGLRKPAPSSSSSSSSSPSSSPSPSSSSSSSSPSSSPSPSSSSSSSSSPPVPPAPAASSASPPTPERPACSRRFEAHEPLALRVVPGVGFPSSTANRSNLTLSLAGDAGEVREGAHLGLFLAYTRGDVTGANLAVFGSIVGGYHRGVAGGGLFHLGDCDLDGAAWGSVFAYQRGNVRGAIGAGVVVGVGGALTGVQGATVGTFAGGKVTGAQVSTVVNVAQGGLEGAQLALLNVAGDVEGAQIGLVNVAGRVHGTQIGLVNVASYMDGFPVGLFSWAGNTRIQGVLWASAQPRYNLGLKFTTGHVYQMFSVSQGDEGRSSIYGLAYTLGLHFPIDDLFVDGDITYQQVFTDQARLAFRLRDENDGVQPWALKMRVLGGYQPFKHLGVFAGGGVTVQMSDLEREVRPDVRQEWSAGVQF